MDEQERREIDQRYKEKKEKGVLFFPDLLFKDALIGLLVFLVLIGLAYFIGAPLEERANPADTSYTPKPEWYFLFLFQLLKYFPGSLEVIGVFVLPTLAILLLLALPFLDRSAKRHPRSRPVWIGITAFAIIAVIGLTIQAFLESPPPVEAVSGDQTAALYLENCAPCHGPSIQVDPSTNLHTLIAQGKHEGMPAWSGDLTTDEIDSLAGFILSPGGSQLFTDNCGACHTAPELVASEPLELKLAIEGGGQYVSHADLDPAEFQTLSPEDRTTLLNFLVAPDGQRLFAVNCAPCHGRSVSFSGETNELEALIRQGGMHLEMPSWRGTLTENELDTLARFVVEPSPSGPGATLYQQYCVDCHGERIPRAADVESAREIISTGGAHETMPVWGDILTDEQLAALVAYTESASAGLPTQLGQELFSQNCAQCHGDFGEGGVNPARPRDIIAPISTAEYLGTRDDLTLRSIIAQGQPNFGMAPFGTSFGGPLEDSEIDAIVAFLRTWEANPPVELPPEVAPPSTSLSGAEIYSGLCAQCHGGTGEGGLGPPLSDPEFQEQNSDKDIFETISLGHPATPMIAWGEILTSEQIQQVVDHIRSLKSKDECELGSLTTFDTDVLPIFDEHCVVCHGEMGGWDGSNYQSAMNTGLNAPVVIPGDPEGSLLARKLLGTQTQGGTMPPSGMLPDAEIEVILDWISDGALKTDECEPLEEPPTFTRDIAPIFNAHCVSCHGTMGGWDGSNYQSVMNTGLNAPVVIPGDPEGSLLAQKLLGTQTRGGIMPPNGKLPDADIQLILDWIKAGAIR